MEPNVYASPTDGPVSPKEYQATVQLPDRSVPWGIRLATTIASVTSAALAVWGLNLYFASVESAAQTSVGGAGISLTLMGHVVFLSFGGIVGLAVAIAIIAISTVTPVQHSRALLPYLAAGIAPVLAVGCLWFVTGGFIAAPGELLDVLFR